MTSRVLTFGGVVAIGLSLIGSLARASDLEAITGKPTHDALGVTHVAAGVKNNSTNTYEAVRLECGLYRGADLVGAGLTTVEFVTPGQTAYGTVQLFDEAAVKADKADCRVAGVKVFKREKEEEK